MGVVWRDVLSDCILSGSLRHSFDSGNVSPGSQVEAGGGYQYVHDIDWLTTVSCGICWTVAVPHLTNESQFIPLYCSENARLHS